MCEGALATGHERHGSTRRTGYERGVSQRTCHVPTWMTMHVTQGTLLGVDCLTVCRNVQYIVYHVMICKTNAWHDIACAHKVPCCAGCHHCHMFARCVVLNNIEPIEGNMCACGMYVRTVSGHHRLKDHQANSALKVLRLSLNQIGNAGACAIADAIKATLVLHGPSLSWLSTARSRQRGAVSSSSVRKEQFAPDACVLCQSFHSFPL